MTENLLVYAENLKNGVDILETLKNIETILEKNCLYKELAGCKEKIWHLNGDDDKLKEISVLYRLELKDSDMAFVINMLYIRRTQRRLYDELIECFKDKQLEQLNPDLDDNSDKFSELWKIADRYCGIEYIISYLLSRKKYEEISNLLQALDEVKQIAEKYLKEHPEVDLADMDDIETTDKNLSVLLSNHSENIEFNKLAIKYDIGNEKAYINILEHYINSSQEDKAIEFYNESYRKQFNKDDDKKKAYKFTDVMWALSNSYNENFDFYNALVIQKKAIDYELTHQNNEVVQ